MDSDVVTRPFRCFDNREKYLLFVTTCSEQWIIAALMSPELLHLHHHYPTITIQIIGKEMSQEDVCISLEIMADRFYEHLQTACVITNLFYACSGTPASVGVSASEPDACSTRPARWPEGGQEYGDEDTSRGSACGSRGEPAAAGLPAGGAPGHTGGPAE